MSSDHDDVGAIAVLHALTDLGECEILGMMVSSTNGGTATCMDAINTYYGRPGIPIGVRPDIGGGGSYPATISTEFPHSLVSAAACPSAASLYRQLLANASDNSVTIVTAGFLTNLKALLNSTADVHSALSGVALVAQKVKLWACMGGAYSSGSEFNFMSSGDDSAFIVVNAWPTAARFSGFSIGTPIGTGGRLQSTPVSNPIRRVWQLKGGADHPSYDQTAVYCAVRFGEGLWNADTVGHNTAISTGANAWATDTDPTGLQDQGYLVEKARSAVQRSIDTLMMAAPRFSGMSGVPTPPTYMRATAVDSGSISLRWTNNAYNETGFVIEVGSNGAFTQLATTGPGVTNCRLTALDTTANRAFRVKSINPAGSSDYAYMWNYSGWTEINYDTPGDLPLYAYFRPSDLRWARGGNDKPNHVTLNNDSTHGTNLTVNVEVGALGAQGILYVYFFYTDLNNWYRLSVSTTLYKFEKNVSGAITAIGSPAPVTVNIGVIVRSPTALLTPDSAGSTLCGICSARKLEVRVSTPAAYSPAANRTPFRCRRRTTTCGRDSLARSRHRPSPILWSSTSGRTTPQTSPRPRRPSSTDLWQLPPGRGSLSYSSIRTQTTKRNGVRQ